MKKLIICVLIAHASTALSAPLCPSTISQLAGPAAVAKYFFKSAIIGDPDRRTLKEFAIESGESETTLAQRYSAPGDIYCGDNFAQAQVVMKKDLILVPAHLLYDDHNCEKARDVKKCRLYLKENGKTVNYEVAKEEAEGFVCPDNSTVKVRNDWAILRLAKPVGSSIIPYLVKAAPCANEEKPADVIFIGKSRDYGRIAGKPLLDAPRHFGRCKVLKGNCPGAYPVIESDCDIDRGSSGGGLFVGGNEPRLIGINSAHYAECPGSATDQTGPYRQKCWSAAAVPIAGELQDRLEKLAQQ